MLHNDIMAWGKLLMKTLVWMFFALAIYALSVTHAKAYHLPEMQDTEIQYTNAGAFGGSGNLVFTGGDSYDVGVRKSRAWAWSSTALVAAATADAVSSWHKQERNPLLGQTFGGRGVAIKAGIIGGIILAEWLLRKRSRTFERSFVIINSGAAAATGVAAAYNFSH